MGLIVWSNVPGLSFNQAKAEAAAKSGVLLNDGSYDSIVWNATKGDAVPDSADTFKKLWVGAELIDGVWRWPNGDIIPTIKFGEESINSDGDPTNDAGPVLLYAGFLRAESDPVLRGNGPFVADGYVMEHLTNRVIGTDYRDIVIGSGEYAVTPVGPSSYMDLAGGDDIINIRSVPASTVNLGSGNDFLQFEMGWGVSSRAFTVIDGTGSDTVSGAGGVVVRATKDGESDEFSVQEVSYAQATKSIINGYLAGDPISFSSEEYGKDTLNVHQVTLGSGDDKVGHVNIIIGGAGNDILTPFERGEGGSGNDTLISVAGYRADLKGQEGDDILKFFGEAKASGGTGSDLFEFHAASKVTINDLGAGDHIDLSRLFDGFEGTVSDAFAQGYLKSTVSKGYTYVSYDANGGADGLTDLITLKGVYHDVADYLII